MAERAVYRCLIRGALLIWLAGLLLAGMSLAQPDSPMGSNGSGERRMQDGGPMAQKMEGLPTGVPIEILHSGRGFAIKENESHVLRLTVETLVPVAPDQIRMLLAANMSPVEIRERVLEGGDVALRGSVMLDRRIYPLVRIGISPPGDNTTKIEADLSQQSDSSSLEVVGSIALVIAPSEGGMVGRGDLEMMQGPGAGRYTVLLDMDPHGCGMGHRDEICR